MDNMQYIGLIVVIILFSSKTTSTYQIESYLKKIIDLLDDIKRKMDEK